MKDDKGGKRQKRKVQEAEDESGDISSKFSDFNF